MIQQSIRAEVFSLPDAIEHVNV